MEGTWFIIMVFSCCIAASCLTIAAAQTNISTDQSALLALKGHITSDSHNLIFPNWSATAPVCNWTGVTCGARHLRVAALNLSYFDLEGTIPPHLGNLSFLVDLDFTNNSFQGPLPQELARLRRLKFINFGFNKVTGTVPTWFGSFSDLQTLSLNGNKFLGSIPTSIFNSSTLQVIDLRDNQLSGRIPREIGNSTSLKEIYLDDNHFIEIPNEIRKLDKLEILLVRNNALEGNVPTVLFNMSSLITLNLHGNNLKGRLPNDICRNIPQIQELNLSQNQLEGPLPWIYRHCKQLVKLYLRRNKLSGNIPSSIRNASQLEIIYIGDNNLTGTIPREIAYLPKLKELGLGFNNLNGLIPPDMFNMPTVTNIALIENQLSGNLPTNIGLTLPNLRYLLVATNNLSGIIPKSISNVSQLIYLDLAENFLSGYIPSTLCALANLEWLSLVSNNLILDTTTPKDNILSCLSNLKRLRVLGLSSNPINTELPVTFFRNLPKSVQHVSLYNCSWKGMIPNDIGNLSSLIILSLAGNKFSGSIPRSLGNLRNLQGLNLRGNKLQGRIPDDICQLRNLGELSLSGNQLSGSIPSCLGQSLGGLRSLALGSNLLNSTIPSSLWRLENILNLNLSSNNLSGSVSESVGNLKNALLIDLSRNHFSGSIPSSIENLQMLQKLYLANNNLEGLIPSSLGKSLSMVVLDLSDNNLSGTIPNSLESLQYLKSLDLSFNKLYGEIPTSGPFLNFSAQSFVSNWKLCGASRYHVPACKKSRSSKSILKFIIIGMLSTIFVVTSIWIVILRRRKIVEAGKEPELLSQHPWRRVSYIELVRATNSFDACNLIGSGGFGSVYKGSLSDGINVAIKVFNLQLEGAFKSFDIECEMLANIRHRNLIKVISCCSQPDFRAMVLNYMHNGNLEEWLHTQKLCLNIVQRLSIMVDVASALEYLHHGYGTIIVHCDLKPSNILLDEVMSAHVADFGIARLLYDTDSITQTITQATIGYMAPEYGMEGIVTRRGDVYSFGIVLMETFTGKKPTDEMFVGELSLKQWVATSSLLDVVDANLQLTEADDSDFVNKSECLSSIMRLALACSADSPNERVNMQEALAILNKIKIKFMNDVAGVVVLNRLNVEEPSLPLI